MECAWRCKSDVVCVDHSTERPKNGNGGAALGDKLLSAILARCTGLQAAWPKQEINVGSAAINLVVAWCKAMMPFGRPMPDCGPGLMFADRETDVLYGHALERDMTASDRVGVALRVGVPIARCRDRRHDSVPGNQLMLYGQANLALVRRTWPAHRILRRPEACIAPRRMSCCNAHHS